MTDKRLYIFTALITIALSGLGQPGAHSIIIDEIFPDPDPSAGLPPSEFIELKNKSASAVQLQNWKLANHAHIISIKKDFVLEPGDYTILCAMADTAEYAAYGNVIGISGFPALNNTADTIAIYSPAGAVIDAVAYDLSWYGDAVKSLGGWSLEMIDTERPCGGSDNWKAAVNDRGGTPGQRNSVDGINTSILSALLLRTYTIDSLNLVAVFDKSLDSSSAAIGDHYQLDEGIGVPINALPQIPLFNEVMLHLSSPMLSAGIYKLSINKITDCAGNAVGIKNEIHAGLPAAFADTGSLVINEVLFNPVAGGSDYVEIYNRGTQIIDLSRLYVATRGAANNLTAITRISTVPWLFFPGDFLVITENADWLKQNYYVKNPDAVFEPGTLPSLPDDAGTVVLLDGNGTIIDELHYNHQWHFPLINNEQGVSLERIDPNKPTQLRDNWTSAASTAGYGTPGYANSESISSQDPPPGFLVEPKIFSPDNDGHDDFCEISFVATQPDQTTSVTIFDASGRAVRYLVRNATIASSGSFRWDGLDDRQRALPVGIYVILVELFNSEGKVKTFKKTVVLARSLR